MGETDIAIIGVGARYPGAADIAAFRDLAWAGRVVSGPVPADRWDHARIWTPAARSPNRTPSAAAAFMGDVTGFAPAAFGITPHRARVMDPQQRLMLETTRQALENAGYAGRSGTAAAHAARANARAGGLPLAQARRLAQAAH